MLKLVLHLFKKYPWLHATPDFLCYCDCCGEGCGEVKCPYCLKDTDLQDYPEKSNSCLKSESGITSLKTEHAYYYQSQQQIFTTGYNYCDFIVCSFNEQISFFCERILPDICHWNSVVPKLTHFWRYCVLPEKKCVSAIICPQFCLLLQKEYYRCCCDMQQPSMSHFFFSFNLLESPRSTLQVVLSSVPKKCCSQK